MYIGTLSLCLRLPSFVLLFLKNPLDYILPSPFITNRLYMYLYVLGFGAGSSLVFSGFVTSPLP